MWENSLRMEWKGGSNAFGLRGLRKLERILLF